MKPGVYRQNSMRPYNLIRDSVKRSLNQGKLNPDEVILVDFDQAHYGFRMWDILYFLTNWDLPSDEEFEKIIRSKILCTT